ncbi:MAG TPA: branched-chain amino acid ABC transporter ATP-binding protein/permease [Acidimicrobiales bacterium]|nr:branched-chain amino acid ABC transporter ATP-binding protein/permease [Acidimicrobiales bacterium]
MISRPIARRALMAAGWVVLGLALPRLVGAGSLQISQFNFILSLVMVAVGLNIVWGYAGQLFLGPGALFAVGGYAAGVLAEHHTTMQSLPVMCLSAAVVAVVIGAVMAIPSLRVGGFYLGLVTLFLAFAAPIVAARLTVLGSYAGVSLVSIDSFHQRPSGFALYESGVVLVALLVGYSWVIVNSRLGRRFTAMRASDDLAQAVGVSTYWTKVIAFLLAAVPCGMGGAFYVFSQQIVSPGSVSPTVSLYVFGGVVIGGAGTILGPILGTALVLAANQFLGGFTKYEGIVFGGVVIAMAAGMPSGLVGSTGRVKVWWLRRRHRDVATRRGLPAAVAPPKQDPPEFGRADYTVNARPLVVKVVSRAFGGVRAVVDVSLVVEPGQVHALVGPNGSGKTTLLNLICGFYRLDRGEIWLGSERLDGHRVSEVTRMGVARTFQTPKLSLSDTALGNVVVGADRCSEGSLLGSEVRGRGSREADRGAVERAEQALDNVGLSHLSGTVAAGLSHSTQRLLEIARAVALEPRLLLLDEPAAGLSVAEANVLKDLVRALAQAGLGVLLVEHNLPVVFDVADQVTVLHQGEVIASGSPAEVSTDPDVVRVYLGRRRRDERLVLPT